MALAAYRHLLRSTRIAFQGDIPTFLAARRAARDSFEQNRGISLNTKEASDAVQHAEDVATILRMNVVQGKAVDGKEDLYKLRIHEHTERGDNETVKFAGRTGPKLSELKCGCS